MSAPSLSASGSRARSLQSLQAAQAAQAPAAAAAAAADSDDDSAGAPCAAPTSRLASLLRLASRTAPPHATAAAEAEYASLLGLVDALRSRAPPAPRRRRTLRLEAALMRLARALHNAGCPAWRLQLRLAAAARGLGLTHAVAVHVFPHHVQFTFSRRDSPDGAGAKTLSVATQPGLDMAALDDADALARRMAAYATSAAPGAASVARNGAGDAADVAAPAEASAPALARAVLHAAASGPGFFRDADSSSSSSSSDSDGGDTSSDDERADLEMAPLRGGGAAATELAPASSASSDSDSEAAARRAAFVSAALSDALAALRAIERAPQQYSAGTQCAAAGVASAGCALVFWGASWMDGAAAGALGVLVAALGLAFGGACGAAGRPAARRAAGFELTAAALVALASRALAAARTHPPLCLPAVRLGALQWQLQGWDITASVIELTNRNAALFGAAHLAVALMVTALLGFGIDIGDTLADAMQLRLHDDADAADADVACAGVAPKWYIPIFVPTAVALCVLLNARRAQVPHMAAIALATFATTWGLSFLPAVNQLNTMLSALVAGYLANAYANRTGKPAVGGAAVGVFVLVPDGMAALDGVADVVFRRGAPGSLPAGLSLTASVLQTSVTIGAGLFVSSLLLSPRELSHVRRHGGGAATEAPPPQQLQGGRGLLARLRGALRRVIAPQTSGGGRGRRRGAYARSRAAPLFF